MTSLIIRAETRADQRAIAAVTEVAFGKEREARMVDAIRASDRFVPELSLVAEFDARVIGHVLLSYVSFEERPERVLELGPMSVLPEHQGRGVGSALVREALRVAEARGQPLVLVLEAVSEVDRAPVLMSYRAALLLGST